MGSDCGCGLGRVAQSCRPVAARAARLSPSDAHVLPKNRRLRSAGDISAVIKNGRRASAATLVVHARAHGTQGGARFGLAVGKVVGGSVVRHRVARRLRAILAEQGPKWDARGMDVVVRALAPAATASSAELRHDLVACGRKLDSTALGRGGRRAADSSAHRAESEVSPEGTQL